MLLVLLIMLLSQIPWIVLMLWLNEEFRERWWGWTGARPLIARGQPWWEVYEMDEVELLVGTLWDVATIEGYDQQLKERIDRLSAYPRTDHRRRLDALIDALAWAQEQTLRDTIRRMMDEPFQSHRPNQKSNHARSNTHTPGVQADRDDWRHVLGVSQDADWSTIKLAYRRLARRHAPDLGGSHEAMARVNVAFAQAREQTGNV